MALHMLALELEIKRQNAVTFNLLQTQIITGLILYIFETHPVKIFHVKDVLYLKLI